MSQPNKWWWGLFPLALLWVVSNVVLGGSIEDDLSSRALQAAGGGIHEPAVEASGRDVTLSGTIFSMDQAAAAERVVNAEWGVRKVSSALQLPPPASPFAWNLAFDGQEVTLTGSVPDPAARQAIHSALAPVFLDAPVRDETTYASGAPAGFADAAAYGIGTLAALGEPALSLSDGAVLLSGRAASIEARDEILNALEDLPQGFALADAQIEAPEPYGFTAERSTGSLTLSGGVPDEQLRAEIAAAAGRLFPGDRIVDGLAVAQGAPGGFAQAVLGGLGTLSRLARGTFSLAGTDAALSGEALYEGALDTIRSELSASLPDGFAAQAADLSVREPGPAIDAAACQIEVDTLLGAATILFETGSARISRDSAGLLDRIVGAFARCPDAAVEIAGHTDSSGDFDANVALSQERAEAVRDYLVSAGLSGGSFTATGYGPTQPVASNDSEEGRAQNRRIAFVVQ